MHQILIINMNATNKPATSNHLKYLAVSSAVLLVFCSQPIFEFLSGELQPPALSLANLAGHPPLPERYKDLLKNTFMLPIHNASVIKNTA